MSKKTKQTRRHDFALVLTGVHEITQGLEDALYEAGCGDATLSQRSGLVYLTFTRSAPSLKDAVISAMRDVRRARLSGDCHLAL